MKVRLPLLAATGVLALVLVSGLVLWFVHAGLLHQRGAPRPRLQLTDLKQGTRFPRSGHHYYATEPVTEKTPSPPELRFTDESRGKVHLPHDLAGELILLKEDEHEEGL